MALMVRKANAVVTPVEEKEERLTMQVVERVVGRLRPALLARPLPDRRGRLHPLSALWRGRLRRERREDPGAAGGEKRDPRHTVLTYEIRRTSTVWLDARLLILSPLRFVLEDRLGLFE